MNLAIARRGRAGIELQLNRRHRAALDINEALRLSGDATNEELERAMRSRIQEVRGQYLLRTDPRRAVSEFTQSIELISNAEYRTLRANLFVQRAEAQRSAGANAAAQSDLRRGIELLRQEETTILANRKRGAGEELWSTYFARFQDTYRLLIRQLMESGDVEEAFGYAEKGRAFEPLMLLQQLPGAPAEFLAIARADEKAKLSAIRRQLPENTFIIQYSVLNDRTFVWVIGRDRIEHLTLQVTSGAIERWTEVVQGAAKADTPEKFEEALWAPYDQLMKPALEKIRAHGKSKTALRIVIVPDGAMHGLPFSALRGSRKDHHLMERFPVTVAGSSALYVFSLLRDRELSRNLTPTLLLIGDPAIDETSAIGKDVDRLPNAKDEVAAIQRMYGDRAVMRAGWQATVPNFLALAHDKTIIHFAGHAVANAEAPSRSYLLFAPSPGQSGALQARDLMTQLKLDRTQLVILSSCSSAGGLPVGPEGMAPLVRPLFASGVPAVIGSLWNVGDATAEALLVSFHRHYLLGSDAAVALQSAQLELLRKNQPALAWGSFQVIGQASSPFATGATHKGATP